jgi:uncharacterized protein (TIGR03437 family)
MVVQRLFLAGLLLSAAAFAQAPQYTITDLGSLPGFPACTATGLSQSGNVTGYCVATPGQDLLDNPSTHGFIYSNGTLTDLNLNLKSLDSPLPMAVNDSGVIAGANVNIDVEAPSVSVAPFIVQSNGTLSLPQGQMQGVLPFGLNNNGQLAGSQIQVSKTSLNLFLNSVAVFYTLSSGVTSILGSDDAAFGINSGGTVAGASVGQDGNSVDPLLWVGGLAQSLPILSPYKQSLATSVNDSGVAAGAAVNISFTLDTTGNLAHAVIFNADGTVTDLGVVGTDQSSLATGINNSGTVVGFSNQNPPDFTIQLQAILEDPKGTTRGFVYTNGKIYDLNTLLTNGTGWSLAYATAINNAGQIIGTGTLQTPSGPVQHGFLLTPAATPPPTGPAITGIAGVAGSVPFVANLSSNGLFAIYGSNLATAAAGINSTNIVNNQLPTNLGGTCVESGTTMFGLFFVSPGQINALAGNIPSTGTIPVSVVTNCGTANQVISPAVNVPVAAVAPEFLYFVQNANGADPVAALDFTTGIDVGATAASFAPAKVGDLIIAYGVGWGPTQPAISINTLAPGAASLINDVTVTLGGVAVDVTSSSFYAGLSPGSAGLYQMNFVVPPGVPAGNQQLILTVDGVPSPGTSTGGPYLTIGN